MPGLGLSLDANVNGSVQNDITEYKGLPYEKLPELMVSTQDCKKKLAIMLIEERIRITPKEKSTTSKSEKDSLLDIPKKAQSDSKESLLDTPKSSQSNGRKFSSNGSTKFIWQEPKMVSVIGGCFQMGSPYDEDGKPNNWGSDGTVRTVLPLHRVCVNNFKLAEIEVTRGQWQSVRGKNYGNRFFQEQAKIVATALWTS